MRGKGFTLIELLIALSIIALLLGILLPSLMTAKERALELMINQVEPNEEGKLFLEIKDPSDKKVTDDIYAIKFEPGRNDRVYLKKPHPSGMKLIRRDGQDYIKWRPKWRDIGVHPITVVFEGGEPSEQEMTVYVFNKALLEEQRENNAGAVEDK